MNKKLYYEFINLIDDHDDLIVIKDPEAFQKEIIHVLYLASYVATRQKWVTGESVAVCQAMHPEVLYEQVSEEEVLDLYNTILMSREPSIGFEFLKEVDCLPGYLKALITCHQRLDFHPEDTVWNHTMLVIGEAAKVRYLVSWPEAFMWSALLHDIGKPEVTTPQLHAHWHSEAGVVEFERSVTLIKDPAERNYIATMILYHMTLMTYQRHNAGPLTYRRFIKILDNQVPFLDLVYISKVDVRGRGIDNAIPIEGFETYIDDLMTRYGTQIEEPLVTRDDLLAIGFSEDQDLAAALDWAYDYQIQDMSKEEILRRMLLESR